ncbi:MAG: hypothetical protein A3F70_07885 [Acidobacteria bacterium RIFCSPLOWO2_12_FULL_67_14]|nr:MAG: hypothetical protein A3H29_13995 [Acidobacteria bacterium RIFCSPLOWO2_02_FULL_67_21]OFW35237.1 MAG: hypothetical protein A3F70_07885 [Acidobacteria bacterium RIFCSPLOWO2_12_FULL_67_14]
MPMYEYECGACGQRFELIRKFSDPPLEVCALCGKGPVTRLQSSPAFQFKGSGWYVTDYAQKEKTGKSDGTTGAGEAKPAETKTDSKTDSGSSSEKTASSSDTAGKSDGSANPSTSPPSTASTKPPKS